MKFLKQLLLVAIFVVGFSLTAMAQKDDRDNKNRPPKDTAEIKPEDKDKPKDENKPKNDNNNNNDSKGKKPQAFFIKNGKRIEISFI